MTFSNYNSITDTFSKMLPIEENEIWSKIHSTISDMQPIIDILSQKSEKLSKLVDSQLSSYPLYLPNKNINIIKLKNSIQIINDNLTAAQTNIYNLFGSSVSSNFTFLTPSMHSQPSATSKEIIQAEIISYRSDNRSTQNNIAIETNFIAKSNLKAIESLLGLSQFIETQTEILKMWTQQLRLNPQIQRDTQKITNLFQAITNLRYQTQKISDYYDTQNSHPQFDISFNSRTISSSSIPSSFSSSDSSQARISQKDYAKPSIDINSSVNLVFDPIKDLIERQTTPRSKTNLQTLFALKFVLPLIEVNESTREKIQSLTHQISNFPWIRPLIQEINQIDEIYHRIYKTNEFNQALKVKILRYLPAAIIKNLIENKILSTAEQSPQNPKNSTADNSQANHSSSTKRKRDAKDIELLRFTDEQQLIFIKDKLNNKINKHKQTSFTEEREILNAFQQLINRQSDLSSLKMILYYFYISNSPNKTKKQNTHKKLLKI